MVLLTTVESPGIVVSSIFCWLSMKVVSEPSIGTVHVTIADSETDQVTWHVDEQDHGSFSAFEQSSSLIVRWPGAPAASLMGLHTNLLKLILNYLSPSSLCCLCGVHASFAPLLDAARDWELLAMKSFLPNSRRWKPFLVKHLAALSSPEFAWCDPSSLAARSSQLVAVACAGGTAADP